MVTATKRFFRRHQKYAPVIFFVGGFIWDSLTLGRIDGWYSNTILFTYIICLTVSICIFNLSDDGHWKNTFIEPYEEYAPLAIQFFLGGLSSAYVLFFFQSVSLTKTMIFFLILVALLISNEFLKHRISSKYLQFGAYFFVNFTFLTFFSPIAAGQMNATIFAVSGGISLACTLLLAGYLYFKSPSTRIEITGWKLGTLILGLYLLINGFYYFNLIPPVPLSLQSGIIAYDVQKTGSKFRVAYEQKALYSFWKSYDKKFNYTSGDTVFVYTSVFAPTDLKKSIQHEWQWYDPGSDKWNITDTISYKVLGGRRGGFRGYTYKENVWPGEWRVAVKTKEGLLLGEIDFRIIRDPTFNESQLTVHEFD